MNLHVVVSISVCGTSADMHRSITVFSIDSAANIASKLCPPHHTSLLLILLSRGGELPDVSVYLQQNNNRKRKISFKFICEFTRCFTMYHFRLLDT